MEKVKKPILAERYADNGEHSHWELIDETGRVVAATGDSDSLGVPQYPSLRKIYRKTSESCCYNVEERCPDAVHDAYTIMIKEAKLIPVCPWWKEHNGCERLSDLGSCDNCELI